MKKFLLFSISLCFILQMYAQQRLVITQTDGTVDTIPVWKIDSINFIMYKPIVNEPPEPVDLGLSVLWAPWNLGAAAGTEKGLLFGWGNVDDTNTSTDKKYYYAPSVTTHIVDSEFDIAKALWAHEESPLWRMPTDDELRELLTCNWSWEPEQNAYKVANKDDDTKFIYLPVTGKRLGELEDSPEYGFYWSGSVGSTDSTAFYLPFGIIEDDNLDASSWNLLEALRSHHFAIRPVYGEYKAPVTASSGSENVNLYGNLEYLKANIKLSVQGEGENLMCYILYGQNKECNEASSQRSKVKTLDLLDGSKSFNIEIDSLDYDRTYYYRAVVVNGAEVFIEKEIHQFTTPKDNRLADLGLSVKWARWNVGGMNERDYGIMVPWGAKDENGHALQGSDVPSQLNGTEYDFANNYWKSEWRIPTEAEFEELVANCKAEIADVDGVFGIRFSRNGDSIFFPYCGKQTPTGTPGQGSSGFYWTSDGYNYTAEVVMFLSPAYPNYFQHGAENSSNACGIRAVFGPNDPSQFIENPDDQGEQGGEGGEGGQGGEGGEGGEQPVNPIPDEVEAVDLGLPSGTLWANKNVGADYIYDSGEYFAYGEISPKESKNYTFENYKYLDPTGSKCIQIGIGYEGIQGVSEYDAATVAWGGDWKIPSEIQFQELIENCDWNWGYENYVGGYYVKSRSNNNRIFIPAANYYQGKTKGENEIGYYWTSTLNYDVLYDFNQAQALYLDNSKHIIRYCDRHLGLPIRAILSKK